MSYINLSVENMYELSPIDSYIIQLSKQARNEDVSDVLSYYNKAVDILVQKGFLEEIKGKKGQSRLEKIRITKLGTEFLDLRETPDIQDGDIQMYKYLTDMYLEEDSTRILGNRKAGLRYCAQFRQIMGFTLHEMYWLCQYYVSNSTYTRVLEYIFFSKKDNPYGKFKDNLDQSKLFQFWEDNEYEIREFWKRQIKE